MFGYVTANMKELTKSQQQRYGAVYCGICRGIRSGASQTARLGLSYDMAFLALLLMSLYEPEEQTGDRACLLHPIARRSWVDNEYIRYCADMNIALGYFKAMDDVRDDRSLTGRVMAGIFGKSLQRIRDTYPRQWAAMEDCISRLDALETENCPNPDLPAACFGELMAQLLVYREDLWADALSEMGHALGRFVYLLDAMADYRRDEKKKKYNPFLAMGEGRDLAKWEDYLVLEMAQCTEAFERLPLVQDKPLLDRILYSGVWMEFERMRPRKKGTLEEKT